MINLFQTRLSPEGSNKAEDEEDQLQTKFKNIRRPQVEDCPERESESGEC